MKAKHIKYLIKERNYRFQAIFSLFLFGIHGKSSNFAHMTLIIVAILIVSYLFIATERLTNINKAAIAVFAGTVGWVLYICWGSDFIMSNHQGEYMSFLHGAKATSDAVKSYIWQNIFIQCVGKASEVVLFLLATMTIVEILHNNGCFDFLTIWLRTRNSRLLMWKLAAFSFILSANLDNISSTVMMLTVTNQILPRTRDRIIYGAVVVLAVNFGGALTVIGDPTSLVLWNMGAITATSYTVSVLLPCLIAWVLPTYLIGRTLSETVQLDRPTLPYRGDDTNLNVWQRIVVLFVGIGGLWFIPTFHSITKLSPFLGAFCVLSILWVVNEIFNRNIMSSDRRLTRSIPRQLQYSIIQLMLYVMGIMLAVGVVSETGAFAWLADQIEAYCPNIWILGMISGFISIFLDNFATAMTMISIFDVSEVVQPSEPFLANMVQNGAYWKIIGYATAVGSSVLTVGSVSGIVYMQAERVGMSWYFRHVGSKVLLAGILGLAVLYFTV